MSQHYNPQTSGMLERYGKEVAPLRKANEKNDVVNKVLMVACLVVCTVAGVVAGYFIGYTLASTFIGLLAGAAAALGLCYLVYFLRKRRFLANKQNADGGEKRIADEYRAHYGMPSQPLETEIVATSDSPLKSQKAVCWADKAPSFGSLHRITRTISGAIPSPRASLWWSSPLSKTATWFTSSFPMGLPFSAGKTAWRCSISKKASGKTT
jgi:F0F1-type ATP synthase assembly protein I